MDESKEYRDNIAEDMIFEEIKHVDTDGVEFWYARELQEVLHYARGGNFKKVIEKATTACGNSGFPTSNHFAGVGKMVDIGSGTNREVDDIKLSRYACYLVAQNGDPKCDAGRCGENTASVQV